jgi:adenylosuccinate lyase
MIPRYSPADFVRLWSEETKYATWLSVELAALSAMEDEGTVPRGVAERITQKNLKLDPKRIEEIERTTKHDVIAFLTHVEELAGPDARWLHRGMTSSDVLDTSFAILLREAADMLAWRTDRLLASLARRAREHAKTVAIGRSHGIFAEPITFGVVFAGHHAEIARGKKRLEAARREIAFGKIAGAVGTYAHLSPALEARALAKLGLSPETVATQIVSRDRHAALFSALALLAASIERFATNVRLLQRSEVGEAEEAFTKGQKGSSAMPHKRNPILSENLCGLSRIVRSAVVPALEDVALWHERDISHSSVERMIAPDATTTLGFMLERAAGLAEGLVIYPENAKKNLDRAGALFFSEAVLLALVDAGMPRQEGYVLVQRNAMRAFEGHGTFHENLVADPDILAKIPREKLDACFDLEHALRHVPAIVERALSAEEPTPASAR